MAHARIILNALALAFAMPWTATSPVQAQGQAQGQVPGQIPAPVVADLFNRQGVNVTFQPKRGRHVIREEPVRIPSATWMNLEVGADVAISFRQGALAFSANITHVDSHREGSRSIRATVAGQPDSSVIISVVDGVAAGWFYVPAAGIHARLQYAGPDTYMLREVNNALLPACGNNGAMANNINNAAGLLAEAGAPPMIVEALDPAASARRGVVSHEAAASADPSAGDHGDEGGIAGTCTTPQPIFDIIILYTAIARGAAGGNAAMEAEILNAIDVSNEAYDNSPINARMRVVHCQEVTYNEIGTRDQHRDRLADPSDGVLDGAHTLRANFGADIVCMWVDDDDPDANGDPTSCGVAYCTPSGPEEGFCIVTWYCAVSNFSLVHEVGHLLSSAHDPDNAGSGCNEFDYSYGHNFFISGTGWRHSVMSYPPSSTSERIPYFSNPNVTFLGTATGTSTRNNRLSITNMRTTVAGWWSSRNEVWVDFEYVGVPQGSFSNPYTLLGSALSQLNQGSNASEPATIWLKPGSSSQAVTIDEPVFLRACNSTVTIGQ